MSRLGVVGRVSGGETMAWLRVLLALIEPVLVFIAATLLSSVLLKVPALAAARAALGGENPAEAAQAAGGSGG